MAAVLDALAPYVINMIKDMSEEQLRMLLGVSGEIKKLGGKVENVKAYLADAERRRINDVRVQRWVSKLKGALYEATDILELCQLDAEERRKRRRGVEEKAPGCLRPLLFFLRNPGFAHAMGGRIKELNRRLGGISEEMAEFRFKLVSFEEKTRPSDATPRSRTTTSLIDESAIVGEAIEEDTRALVQLLLRDKAAETIMVLSIVGPGGMGKTTLAKKIFNDEEIQAAFGSKIWLSVTESYDELNLLASAITQAAGIPRGDNQVLSQTLASTLSSKGKFLLVLDDVWSDGAWTAVLQSPAVEAARKHPGSRVIVTTRNQDLVKDMGAAAYHQHHVKPMDHHDAWSLLKKQLLPQDVGNDDLEHLKDIGMGIIRNCDGLPLAIKAIGGLLRTKRATDYEWNNVLHDPAWKTDKSHHDLNIALQLSYEDLPPTLKQCFLYYSLIPKGLKLHRDEITRMWMSEGFLSVLAGDDEGSSKEEYDVGLVYYRNLIIRNLIEPLQNCLDEGYCMMHDVIRSFAQYMAKEEMVVIRCGQVSWQQLLSSTKFRRLSIESTTDESSEPEESAVLPDWSSISSGKQDLLRSLIISGRMKFEGSTSSVEDPCFLSKQFPSLRTLFVRHGESDRFVESLSKLKHLRFLWLESTDISRLPHDIHKMKFLEFICIRDCARFSGELPSSIVKLERLRHLTIGNKRFSVPKGFGELTNLRSLNLFPVQTDGEWCSLQELGSLSQLRSLMIQGLEQVPRGSSAAAKAKMHEKDQLRDLVLGCSDSSAGDLEANNNSKDGDDNNNNNKQVVEEVFDQLCPPRHLQVLCLFNYLGRQMPSWLMCRRSIRSAVELNNLTSLQMMGLPFCTELPDGLCRLHSLEILIIDFAPAITRVGPEFTGGAGMARLSSSRLSFPRLKFLRFRGLRSWEQWRWEEEEDDVIIAMPFLQELLIIGCSKLERLPAGLASSKRAALRVLRLADATVLTAVENFPSVEKLSVSNCPNLKIIRGFPRMQVVFVSSCPSLEVMEAGPALHTLELIDPDMVTLPKYLRGLIKLRLLRLSSHWSLCDLLLSDNKGQKPSSKWSAEAEKLQSCEKLLVFYPPPSSHGQQRQAALQVVSSNDTIFSSLYEPVFLH